MSGASLCHLSVWYSDDNDLAIHNEAMLNDVRRLVTEGLLHKSAYGTQTEAVLQSLREPHWTAFFSIIHSAINQMLCDSAYELDRGKLIFKAWASIITKLDTPQKIISHSLHSHSTALFSAIYYLLVPEQSGSFGTFFVNPLSMIFGSGPYGTIIPARVGRIVLFNSGIVHAPYVSLDDISEIERIVIAVDAHYVPEE